MKSLLTGMLTGLLMGLLFAPRPGPETLEKLTDKKDLLVERAGCRFPLK